jgi:hypothetical protein
MYATDAHAPPSNNVSIPLIYHFEVLEKVEMNES